MKLFQKLLLSAQLATVVVGQFNLTAPWARKWNNFTHYLEGDEALAYLFNYDPSEPHTADLTDPVTGRPTVEYGEPAPAVNPRYDTNYINRLCSPRIWSWEAWEGADELPSCDEGMSREECNELHQSYDYNLIYVRAILASSPYPCERQTWIQQECGINIMGHIGHNGTTKHKGTFAEQHDCLCKGDYWAAAQACDDCRALHVGDATYKAEQETYQSILSAAVCSEAPTATKSIWDYASSAWRSAYPGSPLGLGQNITIVNDGAQNQTDWSFYMTESVDFVPATIQEPAFTRTLDGKAVVMTPGVMKANAKAKAGSAPAGSQATPTAGAAAAETSKAGAAGLIVSWGLVIAAFGGVMMS